MKKILLLLAATATSATLCAQTVRDNVGCGLGSMALGDETGLVSNVVGATLNGISGNQTFGVSSGTLECEQATRLVRAREVESFIADNMDHIAIEAANGEGAYLAALADLLKIEQEERDNFFLSMQINFNEIFPHADAHPSDVTRSIVQLI